MKEKHMLDKGPRGSNKNRWTAKQRVAAFIGAAVMATGIFVMTETADSARREATEMTSELNSEFSEQHKDDIWVMAGRNVRKQPYVDDKNDMSSNVIGKLKEPLVVDDDDVSLSLEDTSNGDWYAISGESAEKIAESLGKKLDDDGDIYVNQQNIHVPFEDVMEMSREFDGQRISDIVNRNK
jgi:hypothetical protein